MRSILGGPLVLEAACPGMVRWEFGRDRRWFGIFAQALNDSIPDDLRSRLLSPFVRRLAGSYRSAYFEAECWRYIVREVYRRIVGEEYEPSSLCYDVVNDIELSDHPRKVGNRGANPRRSPHVRALDQT
jgi:hypothetical protein